MLEVRIDVVAACLCCVPLEALREKQYTRRACICQKIYTERLQNARRRPGGQDRYWAERVAVNREKNRQRNRRVAFWDFAGRNSEAVRAPGRNTLSHWVSS